MNMKRIGIIFLLFLLVIIATASDVNEVLRAKEDTYKPLKLTKLQESTLHKLDDKYGSELEKLRKSRPSDYVIKRDSLNEKYTRAFMSEMSPIQKSTYRKYIRSLRQNYRKAHPEIDADNIFIWGGANLL